MVTMIQICRSKRMRRQRLARAADAFCVLSAVLWVDCGCVLGRITMALAVRRLGGKEDLARLGVDVSW